MVLVELIRLVIVLALTAAGYTFGERVLMPFGFEGTPEQTSRLVASVIGAGLGYVSGGILGRGLLTAIGAVERRVDRVSGGELLTGAVGLVVGAAAGTLLAWPIIAFVPVELISIPSAFLVLIVVSYTGLRVSQRKRFDLLGMMGLAQPHRFLARERSASAPQVLDTSAIIDGRIVDVARSGFLRGHIVCPGFVLSELRSIADSSDGTRRARGRRGLEILEALQAEPGIRLEVTDDSLPHIQEVDAKLVALARTLKGALITTDFNLHKTAELHGVTALNVNSLAESLQPVLLPGEELTLRITKQGTQDAQGVGYLDDGTMIVVEGAAPFVGREVIAVVTSSLQTGSGKMLFSTMKPKTAAPPGE